ncbi:GDP-mannose-dependent alpha-(1-6)-phosphatidylinositol monomannoside mannosyltransferase [Thalassovita gelatinovora]|uniref:GDP-mannose-dependent alpha-(1-6)-phosphatidylinositol monomannoside mannosyltransferase n=1 Tax=Thalassovita gelatinovora TaxID=53501 RepID=A0A0P1F992_THAGE|nr:glycosyltransferase family 4 protein [Thalassovita gelatinovora]QIZ81268.1 glycosyltransferase family 4 protein [Thalassovita gelatinovora]CUH64604.1 GDP-mannose-dependent alpha-(1-6)-phosphatidylinositol monomannoside mannosyltransferase [Thalassovita gelatinovora]SEP95196.1 Glycosyltransferase involved in cell wall bisynthesis [Thalassovita gelatinovora]
MPAKTSTASRPLRVLIIAEAANPEWVSVPLVGWSLAGAIGRKAEIHIVTQIRNRDAFLRAGLMEGRDFTAIDSEAIARPLWALGKLLRMGEGKGWTALQLINALSYPYFEYLIWKRFGPMLRKGQYDVVHRVTPLSPTISSPIARKCARIGVPFVVGPLNGGVPWPKGFDAERRREREWLSYLRAAYKLMPGRRGMLRHAAAIIVGSHHTRSEIPARFQDKTVYIPENAIDPDRFNARAAAPDGVLRACFIGRLVPYKGPDMLLEAALPLLQKGLLQLDLIGDGPQMESLKRFAADHEIENAVTFHGWLDHGDVQNVAAQSQLLAFPSVREFGGGVVLEAMALGLVPLIVDYAGPSELVTPGTGFKVPIGSRDQIVAGFHTRLTELASHPEELTHIGVNARNRVDEFFTWDRKADQVLAVYDWVLGHHSDKPNPFAATAHPRKDTG